MARKLHTRNVVTLLLLIGIVFALTSVSSAEARKKNPKDIVIAYVTKELTNPFFVESKWGGNAAANKHGVQYVCLAPEKYSVENQIRIIEDLIQRKVDAIIINPIDGKGIIPGIMQANRAGIPVMGVDTKPEGGDLVGFVTIDNVLMGRVLAQAVVDEFDGKAKVIILEGTTGASSAQERQQGIMEVFGKHPGIEILQSTTARYDRQTAMRVMENLLVRFPEIDAVVAHNDVMALGAIEAIKEARRMDEISLIGSDAIPEALASVSKGELYGTVEGKGFEEVFAAVDLVCEYLINGVTIPEGTIYLQDTLTVINKDNVSRWGEYRENLYGQYGLKVPGELKVRL